MIATRLGVLITAAIALVLGVVLAIDLSRGTPSLSTALVERFDTDAVTRLSWSRSGEPDVVLDKKDKSFVWVAPYHGIAADPAAVDSLLAALRGGHWHRRDRVGQAGIARATLTVTGKRTLKIAVGAPLEGANQTWLAIGDHAYLVDDWIARALAPDPLSLRETRPFRDIASAQKIVIDKPEGALTLEGPRLTKPLDLFVARDRLDALLRALTDIAIIAPADNPHALYMTVSAVMPPLVTVEFYGGGGCKTGLAIGGTLGAGCIPQAQADALQVAITALQAKPIELVDSRLAPFEPLSITLPDSVVIGLEAHPPLLGHHGIADATKLAELLAMLETPIPQVVEATTAKVTGTLVVRGAAGAEVTIEVLANQHARRKGEPVEFVPGQGAIEILMRPSSDLRDSGLWMEEQTTIHAITVDGTTFTRGAVLGEWDNTDQDKELENLASALTIAHGTELKRTAETRHAISFEVKPPGGKPTTRSFQVGQTSLGCEAIVDGKNVRLLKNDICDALAAIKK